MTSKLTREKVIALIAEHSYDSVLVDALDYLLAEMDSEPVAYMYDGEDGREYNGHNEFSGGGKGIPLYRHAQPAPVVPECAIHRDANRYRFLRDKDAFGDENALGLVSWDDLSELNLGDFDAAVDARINDSGIALYNIERLPTEEADADIYAELYRLRSEIKGPDGFDTWRDAAIAEKKARVELERQINQSGRDIDYLGAMAAFHSDKWHKMDPITGYMHGWNARRNHAQQPVVPDGLIAAVNRLLDSDGSRGCYSAIQCGDAHDEIERLLAAALQEVK